ncbi:thioesterase of the a b hydrolase superfamily [Cryptosporidium sp. chipmunk genotype I]|uniref:thioesterase of the a b hydrolase superfamily n=1 Tax=Cryptosporidium sp. chipmunk genotype I TaxID=1280935 RepID=UPI00351A466E|nr:thioesterase of the a b hydrolase superfamily [Cryptosporidium sp. chipmunk genotype I]
MTKSDFDRWFPSHKKVNSHLINSGSINQPTFRLLCIHGAGGSDQIFVKKDLNVGMESSNILLDYIQENGIELLALQLPGRAGRSQEACYKDITTLLNDFYPVFKSHFFGEINLTEFKEVIPWVIVGHSMGGLIGFELLKRIKFEQLKEFSTKFGVIDQVGFENKIVQLLREKRIFPELFVIMSTFPPNIPECERPWRKNEELNGEEFKQECSKWGINENVFKKNIWEEFEQQLRCDFRMFDSFEMNLVDKALYCSNQSLYNCMYPLGVKSQLWSASQDNKVTKDTMNKWKELLVLNENSFDIREIDGKHNFLHDPKTRREWMQELSTSIDKIILDLEYY